MRLLDETNAAAYLREVGRLEPRTSVAVRALAGGVSNVVLLVEPEDQPPFVIKQARGQLRVADPWFCSVERIWREVAVLRWCGRLLEGRSATTADATALELAVPRILWEDRAEYLYAMTAAASDHRTWKQELLAGKARQEVAVACGRMLGVLHARSWRDPWVAAELADRTFFDALRIDPYYHHVAAAHEDLRPGLERLIEELAVQACALVHGDFSPKNLLCDGRRLLLIDHEAGHYGDPAFDLGFFHSHLALKAIHFGPRGEDYWRLSEAFWPAYLAELSAAASPAEQAALVRRAVANFAACALARVDGKSKVEYLHAPEQQERVRRFARDLLLAPCPTWHEALARARSL